MSDHGSLSLHIIQIFPVVGGPKNLSRAGSREIATLSALDECSEGTTSRSVSLSSFTVQSLADDKQPDALDSKPISVEQEPTEADELQAVTENAKTDNEDSLTEELGDVTVESIDSINHYAASEPELDLRLREPDEGKALGANDGHDPYTAAAETLVGTETQIAEAHPDGIVAQRVAGTVSLIQEYASMSDFCYRFEL